MSILRTLDESLEIAEHVKRLHQFINKLNEADRKGNREDVEHWMEHLVYETEKINADDLVVNLQKELCAFLES